MLTALCLPPQMLNVPHQQTLGDAISNSKWERKEITQWKFVEHEANVENPRKYYQSVFQKTKTSSIKTDEKYCQNCGRGLQGYFQQCQTFVQMGKIEIAYYTSFKIMLLKEFHFRIFDSNREHNIVGCIFCPMFTLTKILQYFAKLYSAGW